MEYINPLLLAVVVLSLAGQATGTEITHADIFPVCSDVEGIDEFGCALSILLPSFHYDAFLSLVVGAIWDGFLSGLRGFVEGAYDAGTSLFGLAGSLLTSPGSAKAEFINLITAVFGLFLIPLRYFVGVVSAVVVYLIILFLEITKTYILVGIPFSILYAIIETAGIVSERDKVPLEVVGVLILGAMFLGTVGLLSYDLEIWRLINVF